MSDEDDERLGGLPPIEEPKHAADRRSRKKLKDKDDAEKLAEAYLEIMSSPAGRLVMYDRLDKMNYWLVPYDPSSPHNTAYLNGAHGAAVDLYEDLWRTSKDLVLTMLKENRT